MDGSVSKKTIKLPFAVASIFFLISGLFDLFVLLQNIFLPIFNRLHYYRNIEELLQKIFSVFDLFFFIYVFADVLMIAIAILLFIKKPNFAMPVLLGFLCVIYAIYALDNVHSFFFNYFGFDSIFDIIQRLDVVFKWLTEDLFGSSCRYFLNYFTNSLYSLAFLVMIPISVNACLKKEIRFLSVIWFVPGLLAIAALFLFMIRTIHMSIYYDFFDFNNVIYLIWHTIFAGGILSLGLWFSNVWSARRFYAAQEKDRESYEWKDSHAKDANTPVAPPRPVPDPRPVQTQRPQRPAPQAPLQSIPQKNVPFSPSQPQATPIGIADELRKYSELLDKGVITQEEFEIIKKQLLNI